MLLQVYSGCAGQAFVRAGHKPLHTGMEGRQQNVHPTMPIIIPAIPQIQEVVNPTRYRREEGALPACHNGLSLQVGWGEIFWV